MVSSPSALPPWRTAVSGARRTDAPSTFQPMESSSKGCSRKVPAEAVTMPPP